MPEIEKNTEVSRIRYTTNNRTDDIAVKTLEIASYVLNKDYNSLMDNEYQLDILDMFSKGEITPYLEKLNSLIDDLNEVKMQLDMLGGNLEQKQNLIDLYNYQINEIDSANIKDGEYEDILQQIKEMKEDVK